MPKKIGLMVGREWSFPPAFLDAVNRSGGGVVAEYVRIGTTDGSDTPPYDVIVDRISDEVPFYRSYLRQAALQGVCIVNNPFVLDSADHFGAAVLARRIGLKVPPTVLLPQRDYSPEIVHEESLRNLDYPLDWEAAVARVGTPFVLRAATRASAPPPRVCESVEELLLHYNESGQQPMLIQGSVAPEHHVRCLVVGDEVMPLAFDPAEGRYRLDHEHLSATLGDRLVRDSLRFCTAAGLEVNAIDWAVRGNEAYAVRLLDPFPDLDVYTLTNHYFERMVELVAARAVRLATAPGEARGTARRTQQPNAASGTRPSDTPETEPDGAGDLAEGLPSLAQGLPRSELQ